MAGFGLQNQGMAFLSLQAKAARGPRGNGAFWPALLRSLAGGRGGFRCGCVAFLPFLGLQLHSMAFQSVQAQAAREPCGNRAHLPVGAPNFPAEEAEQLEDF